MTGTWGGALGRKTAYIVYFQALSLFDGSIVGNNIDINNFKTVFRTLTPSTGLSLDFVVI